jgi:hypothetical protein
MWLWREPFSVSSTRLKYVRGRKSRVKAEDRKGFDTDQVEFQVFVAADTE